MGALETVAQILAKLPPEAVKGFIDMLGAIFAGKPDKAELLARNAANAIAAREIVKRRFAKP
jgi:hypothetical protein